MSTVLTELPRPAVAGYVEAMTDTAALGWAWTPGQAEPLSVELHHGEQVVAKAVADSLREDLARSGIGEGRHAFTLPIPEALRPRLAELRVVARTPGGAVVPLGSPPVEDSVAERLTQLHRGMEMLIGSQRLLHRNLQAALLAPAEAAAPQVDVGAAQSALQEGIATLELFVVRLEQGLAATVAPPAKAGQASWALAGIAALSMVALVASVWAITRVMLG